MSNASILLEPNCRFDIALSGIDGGLCRAEITFCVNGHAFVTILEVGYNSVTAFLSAMAIMHRDLDGEALLCDILGRELLRLTLRDRRRGSIEASGDLHVEVGGIHSLVSLRFRQLHTDQSALPQFMRELERQYLYLKSIL